MNNNINVWQTWENVVEYIKDELGASVQKLELSDDEIIDKIYKNVLPEFSAHSDLKKYYKMTENHIIQRSPLITYQIKDFKYRIFGISGKIDNILFTDDQLMNMNNIIGDITDFLVRQNYIDMANIAKPVDTYKFLPPDKIQVIKSINSFTPNEFILELKCIHEDPTTIDPTLYNEFLNLSLAYIMKTIANIRKKFSNFSTPFGQIQMNADEMKQEAKQLHDETIQNLLRTPNDKLLWIL